MHKIIKIIKIFNGYHVDHLRVMQYHTRFSLSLVILQDQRAMQCKRRKRHVMEVLSETSNLHAVNDRMFCRREGKGQKF